MRTDIQTTVAKTAAFTGASIDVSGIPAKSWTLFIKITGLTAGQSAVLTVEDTVDNFSADVRPVLVQHVTGGQPANAENVFSFRWHQMPDARFGTASAKLRMKVASITGGTLTYSGWFES